jgi:hypothetical protein
MIDLGQRVEGCSHLGIVRLCQLFPDLECMLYQGPGQSVESTLTQIGPASLE